MNLQLEFTTHRHIVEGFVSLFPFLDAQTYSTRYFMRQIRKEKFSIQLYEYTKQWSLN